VLEFVAQGGHEGLEMALLERLPEVVVVVLLEGVQVELEGAREEDRVLGDDGEPPAEVVEADLGGVDAVDGDVPLGGLDEAEQAEGERGLSGPGPPHHAHLHGRG
jgi:hypothetical protein